MYFNITLIAYIIDKLFGEFTFIRHPVMIMGDYIKWFEKNFYKDDVVRGVLLNLTLISIVTIVVCYLSIFIRYVFPEYIGYILLGTIASTTIASKMLYTSVKDILNNPQNIRYLVSRDTKELSQSEINKASIETYAENLSDGVVAPIFYLLFFGLCGAFVYKAINTLDSMVGYRNDRYEKFGKFSAKLDDIANYIPARITAFIIVILSMKSKTFQFYRYGKLHESPNAGHPISAMALSLDIRLGGDTSYFGKIKKKAYFGDGKIDISKKDIENALKLQPKLDIFIVIFLLFNIFIK